MHVEKIQRRSNCCYLAEQISKFSDNNKTKTAARYTDNIRNYYSLLVIIAKYGSQLYPNYTECQRQRLRQRCIGIHCDAWELV